MNTLLDKHCILFDIDAQTKEESILILIKHLYDAGKITSIEDFYKDTLARESITPTAIGFEIGLPHGKSDYVKEAGIAFGRLSKPIFWNSNSTEPVSLILLIAVPKTDASDTHLKILASLSRKIMHDDFRKELLLSRNPEQVCHLLNHALKDS